MPGPQANAATAVPTRPSRPEKGDALCFELKLLPGKDSLRLGREPKSDIEINDATVSREQLQLFPSGDGGWLVQPLSREKPVLLDGKQLALLEKVPLPPGTVLTVGAARLSYYDPQGFLGRLKTHAIPAP